MNYREPLDSLSKEERFQLYLRQLYLQHRYPYHPSNQSAQRILSALHRHPGRTIDRLADVLDLGDEEVDHQIEALIALDLLRQDTEDRFYLTEKGDKAVAKISGE